MIKIIKVYRDSRILENGTLDTLGLAIKNDNNFDILRFKFDEFVDGTASLLTTLEDENNEKIAFPLTKNVEENSYDLVITREIASTNELEFQLLITYQTDVVWHSRIAKLQILNALDVGSGTTPTTIENWLENANIILDAIEDAETTRNNNENSRITNERLRVQAEDEREEYITDLKQRVENGEFDGQDGVSAIISDATATIDSNIGTPSVNVTLGGTDLDRTFAFEFHNLKGEKGDTGSPGAVKFIIVQTLPIQDIQTDAVYLVPKQDPTTTDLYDEYMYINNQWELLGQKQIAVDLTDYVKFTNYATSSKGGVIKTGNGVFLSGGVINGTNYDYQTYNGSGNGLMIGKGTLENVISGKGLVSNTDYANASTGGVVRVTDYQGASITDGGAIRSVVKTYAQYTNSSATADTSFISKGTLENVLNEKIGSINNVLDAINGEVV